MRFTDSTQCILLRGVQYDNRHRTPQSGGGGWDSGVKYRKVDLSNCNSIAACGQVLMFLGSEEIIF
jgi:hypothetical protein